MAYFAVAGGHGDAAVWSIDEVAAVIARLNGVTVVSQIRVDQMSIQLDSVSNKYNFNAHL